MLKQYLEAGDIRFIGSTTYAEDDPESIRFQFQASRRSGDEVLIAEDLSLSFGGPPIFQNVSLDIRRGEKIFLIGPNGCGKTSLFKILLQQYVPDKELLRESLFRLCEVPGFGFRRVDEIVRNSGGDLHDPMMFYPGKSENNSFSLFGMLPDHHTYRADRKSTRLNSSHQD